MLLFHTLGVARLKWFTNAYGQVDPVVFQASNFWAFSRPHYLLSTWQAGYGYSSGYWLETNADACCACCGC
jgi:hypothetical protein